MDKNKKQELVRRTISEEKGIVKLFPNWVPREFLIPGRRLKLNPKHLYATGAARGGIDERWLASTTRADNGPGTPEDEGLSYIAVDTSSGVDKILLSEAVEFSGDEFLGNDIMSKYGGWQVLSKFFDNQGPIPHHMHQMDEHAAKVGRLGKPEAYYFPVQLNLKRNDFPYTFFGLEPGTRKDDVKECLARWNEGDNGILDFSKAYRLQPGTGWDVPAGILHAPGSLVTYELQKASDVFAIFQSLVEGRYMPRELLTKDVPEKSHNDLDYIVEMLDWEKNVDPCFVKSRFRIPRLASGSSEDGFSEKWVIYGSDCFSGKELNVESGVTAVVKDNAAYGIIVLQGHGKIEDLPLESPAVINFGELTCDEFFVTVSRAREGVRITNESVEEPLVMLKHFGPGNPDAPVVEG